MPLKITKPITVIILAAGQGKRMQNPDLPKVLVPLSGKPLLQHVTDQAALLHPQSITFVIGHKREKVRTFASSLGLQNTHFAVQDKQMGTGHAVGKCRGILKNFEGETLILLGDVPLLRSHTLSILIEKHNEHNLDLSVLSAITSNPSGYGRIIRGGGGEFKKIVEDKDANMDELASTEINSGIFLVDNQKLFSALEKVSNKNAQGEYYLTDIVEIFVQEGWNVSAHPGAGIDELQGINSAEDLQNAEKYYDELIMPTKIL
jgi:bifunctional UDP-N-acetylglucosamine pyrophosphorylase / glucosamine-1-phosphate N-acetyltransferase